ncbi:MAG: type II secretion system F family protein [Selenomonadaceae bacterium]|nr:type II secretion system F family protein [Selenomonadaceae bacterium]
MQILIAAIVAFLSMILVFLIVLIIRRSQSTDIFHRLRRHYADNEKRPHKNDDIIRRFSRLVKRLARPLASSGFTKKLDFRLKQAGIPLFGAEFIVLSAIGGLFGGVVTYIVTLNIKIAPLVAIGIPIGLWIWSSIRVEKRRNAFTEQLSDCLTTVANALRAGYSFQQAMDVVSKEMEPPISSEFERVSTDIAMGVTLEEALEQMNARVASPDFDLVVTAVLIQREIGGNLAQILDTISDTINERIRMKREIKALTAQGRFSAWVLILLPFVTAAFCYVFNHDQTMLLFTEESGRIALAVALVMEFLGFVVIQKIVDIEV